MNKKIQITTMSFGSVRGFQLLKASGIKTYLQIQNRLVLKQDNTDVKLVNCANAHTNDTIEKEKITI